MTIVGDKLRNERENRGIQRVDVARATKVYIHHLAALEHGSFDELPDDGVLQEFVRVYAEYLGLDAPELVAEFCRERGIEQPAPAPPAAPLEPQPEEQVRADPAEEDRAEPEEELEDTPEPDPEEAPEEPIEPGPPPAPEHAEPVQARPAIVPATRTEARRFPIVPLVIVAAVILALLLWWGLRGSPGDDVPVSTPPAEVAETTTETREADERPAPPPAEAAAEEPAVEPAAEPPPAAVEPPPGDLTVLQHGVGTAVVNRRLVGESDRFTTGTEVWFWTRVQGGAPGRTIRHVWLHEGRVIESVSLALGGPHWRTQSSKRLRPGSAGRWVVEARDEAGNMLARSEFRCAD